MKQEWRHKSVVWTVVAREVTLVSLTWLQFRDPEFHTSSPIWQILGPLKRKQISTSWKRCYVLFPESHSSFMNSCKRNKLSLKEVSSSAVLRLKSGWGSAFRRWCHLSLSLLTKVQLNTWHVGKHVKQREREMSWVEFTLSFIVEPIGLDNLLLNLRGHWKHQLQHLAHVVAGTFSSLLHPRSIFGHREGLDHLTQYHCKWKPSMTSCCVLC